MVFVSIITLFGLGLVAAILLSIASRVFYVKEDPRVEAVLEVLPGANCGGCGFAGCEGYAAAVVSDPDIPANKCCAGGADTAIAVGNAPGMLNATFSTRVFEPGGDASIHSQTVPFSPFSSYVGINLNQPKERYIETDKDHRFDIVTVNDKGQLTDRSNLEYKIYRIDWSWWWEKRNESFGTYINSSSITPVASGNLQTSGGRTSFKFRINYPDWGRYLVYVKDKESGHATGGTVYIDWPEWRGRSNKTDPSGIKMLAFSLDKDSYEPNHWWRGRCVVIRLPLSSCP